MNVFIIFVKFLDWIVAIWVRLARFIEENGGLRFWKGGVTTKMKYIISFKKKKNWTRGGSGPLGPPPRSVPAREPHDEY